MAYFYTANALMSLGLSILSGSLWVALLALYGTVEMLRAMYREEAYLLRTFPQYRRYQGRTRRLLPFIY